MSQETARRVSSISIRRLLRQLIFGLIVGGAASLAPGQANPIIFLAIPIPIGNIRLGTGNWFHLTTRFRPAPQTAATQTPSVHGNRAQLYRLAAKPCKPAALSSPQSDRNWPAKSPSDQSPG